MNMIKEKAMLRIKRNVNLQENMSFLRHCNQGLIDTNKGMVCTLCQKCGDFTCILSLLTSNTAYRIYSIPLHILLSY